MQQEDKKEKILVYGVGSYFQEVGSELQEQYHIVAYADRNVGKRYGLEIISLEQALKKPYDKIILTLLDIRACYELIQILLEEYKVDFRKIVLGNIYKYKRKEISYFLEVNDQGNIVFHQDGISIITRNIDEYNNILEIYASNCYGYFFDNKEDVVLDIGMNIGGAALFFAAKENVKKVFAYEPFLDTYLQAKQNIERNRKFENKIRCFQYGIGDRTEQRELVYNAQMSCGQSTVKEKNNHARENYQEWNLLEQQDDKVETILIKDIKDILTEIYGQYKEENIVLKMDCEGEEYGIFKRMDEDGLFQRIKIIMMEWHYDGKKELIRILKKNGFMFWDIGQGYDTGLIYAVNLAIETVDGR